MNLLLNTPALTVYEHMALDETLVSLRAQEVTLRFFNWTSAPAATYGYAQFYREVCRALPGDLLTNATRRPTGGGLVFHRDDLTFSLIFQHAGRPAEIYQKLHGFILQTLTSAGARFTLSGVAPKEAYLPSRMQQASACFSSPVENDLLSEQGKKVLGGALRRFGTTVLYQGSLQLPCARTTAFYKQAVINGVRQFLAVDFVARAVPPAVLEQARRYARQQYQSASWKEKF